MSSPLMEPPPNQSWPRRVGAWLNERTHLYDGLLPIIQHPVPKEVNWWYVFGSATLIAFIIQVVTGVALAMTYVPSTNDVYNVLVFLSRPGTFSSLVRGMHYWGASAMVVLIGIHAMRVFLMGSYKYPRELNWITGTLLLFFTAAMAFSGQLLRWDQDAYWAVVVGAEQAGRTPLIGDFLLKVFIAGDQVSGTTLTRFFATHVFLLPALMFMFIGVHLYLVVLDGISELPKAGRLVDPRTYKHWYHDLLEHAGVPFFPDAGWKDAAFGTAVVGVVLLLAVVIGPKPLGAQADPTQILTYPRPDWYFIWYFAILALIPPVTERYVIIGVPALIFVVMIIIPFMSNKGERSPLRRPWAITLVFGIVLLVGALTVEGFAAPWSPVINAAEAVPIPPDIRQRLSGDQVRGAALFQQRGCHTCHALEGQGGHRGPDLTTIADRYSRDQMIARIMNGAPNMPAIAGSISNDDLKALVDFMETLESPQQTAR